MSHKVISETQSNGVNITSLESGVHMSVPIWMPKVRSEKASFFAILTMGRGENEESAEAWAPSCLRARWWEWKRSFPPSWCWAAVHCIASVGKREASSLRYDVIPGWLALACLTVVRRFWAVFEVPRSWHMIFLMAEKLKGGSSSPGPP